MFLLCGRFIPYRVLGVQEYFPPEDIYDHSSASIVHAVMIHEELENSRSSFTVQREIFSSSPLSLKNDHV